jgi:hypothetical protein
MFSEREIMTSSGFMLIVHSRNVKKRYVRSAKGARVCWSQLT